MLVDRYLTNLLNSGLLNHKNYLFIDVTFLQGILPFPNIYKDKEKPENEQKKKEGKSFFSQFLEVPSSPLSVLW